MKKFFRFTYRAGKPVCDYGKIVLLDRHRNWRLVEGVEYIIEDLQLLELEKCIIIKSGSFLRVDDLPPSCEVSGGPYIDAEKREINFSVHRTVKYWEEVISSDRDYKNFTFGLVGNEEFYDLLPQKIQQQIDDFRVWIAWVRDNQLVVLDGREDFLARRGFRLQSETESLKVETSGYGSEESPKEVSVAKLQTGVYEPVFQNGFEPSEPAQPKEVVKQLGTLSLEESGLPFSFRPVWKSPSRMVGRLTLNGEEVKGLVVRNGDGTGSILEDAMYRGYFEMPPSILSESELVWIDSGGRACWVYEFTRDLSSKSTPTIPSDPGDWIRVVDVCSDQVRYIRDSFDNQDYIQLVKESASRSRKNK